MRCTPGTERRQHRQKALYAGQLLPMRCPWCRRFFAREIAAYDIQTKRCDLYGQDEDYSERVMLIYDGLHYDALAVAGNHTDCTSRRMQKGLM